MIYYTIYKVTNLINQKTYIGLHRTKNLNDGYLGSGKIIKESINKHGKESFSKEILFIFDNFNDMVSKERELVDDAFIQRQDTYNIIRGGSVDYKPRTGANNPMFKRKKTPEQIEKTACKNRGRKKSQDVLQKLRQRTGANNPMFKRKKTPEQIEKTASKNRGRNMPLHTKERLAASKYKPVICENNIEFISIKDCAQYYNVDIQTIRNWIKKPSKSFRFKNVQ